MAEKENNNEDLKPPLTNASIIRKQIKNITRAEFPKIKFNHPDRKSTDKSQIFKFLFRTEEEKEEDIKIMYKVFRHATPVDMCIEALKKHPQERPEEYIKIICFYLQMLKNFMIIFKGQIESEELKELLYIMASNLKYMHIEKNKFIFKFGDKANIFFIILKGKVTFCVPKLNKYYLNEEEYIMFLCKLRLNKDKDLIKKNMETNKCIYDLGDNFDHFVLNSLTRHEKQGENIYSEQIYSYFKKLREIIKIERYKKKFTEKIKEEKEGIHESIKIEEYLERSSPDVSMDPEEAKRNKRKLLEIYIFEKTNTFENGDCFGLIGSNNKSHKRSATAITFEDCELAFLYRDEYNEVLNKITRKARERLFNLVISHKIFSQITKGTFSNKYSHMFRFNRFYLNNIIMDDTKVFNQVIIFNSGEFILSVNKNIIELNELIVKMKKIKGMMNNIPEEIVNKNLNEIKENEQYKLNQKYTSKIINEYIQKRQHLIISTVNDKMMLGYPDTVEPGTFMPLFNCKCSSTTATGYIVEREMINLFKKDHYLRTTPSQTLLLKIDFYLKRLLQYKKNILKRIALLDTNGKKINKNTNNNDSNKLNNINDSLDEENIEDDKEIIDYSDNAFINDKTNNDDNIKVLSKEDMKEEKEEINLNNESNENDINISRNNIIPINLKNNNIFEFQKEKKSSQFEQFFSPRLTKNNISSNNKKNVYHSLDKTTPQNKQDNLFFKEILNLKQKINQKKYLLLSAKMKSHKYLAKESIETKKIQIKLNKLNSKGNYNDLTMIFSKNPKDKKSILDKYLKKPEDNVLDPVAKDINRQMHYNKRLTSLFPKLNKTININNTDTNIENSIKINNITIDNNINNYNKLYKKIKNKLLFFDNEDITFNSNKKTFNIFNNNSRERIKKSSFLFTPDDSELRHIKLNYNNLSLDVDKIKNNNFYNMKTLSNELYHRYIMSELNKKHKKKIFEDNDESPNENEKKDNNILKYQKIDNHKINKIQLMNIQKEKEKNIKSKYFSPENILDSTNIKKKGISLVDPLVLDKFNQIYIKERFNVNN